jgi:hypothetical protein
MYQHHLPSMGKKKKKKTYQDQSGMCKSPYQSNTEMKRSRAQGKPDHKPRHR